MTWQPIESAPVETEVLVRLSCGREAVAEYWEPPPIELDPEQEFGGWAISMLGTPDMVSAFEDGDEIGHPVVWQPLPTPPQENDDGE